MQECRERVAKLLNAESPERVALTLNATDGLNMAIKGLLVHGDHVVTSEIEHNSINRPLAGLAKAGLITVTKVKPQADGSVSPADVSAAMTRKTKLVAITHCSNVLGVVNPADEYAKIAPIREEYLKAPYPASTLIVAKRLIFPELLVEIEAVAVIPDE